MSRARFALAACVAVVAAAVAVSPASAATSASANQTVKFTDQSAVQLTLSNTSYDFGVVDPLATSTSAANATVATVFSNSPWRLQVKGSGNFTDGTGKTIPDSRMSVTSRATTVPSRARRPPSPPGATATPTTGTPNNLQYALTLAVERPISTARSGHADLYGRHAVTP